MHKDHDRLFLAGILIREKAGKLTMTAKAAERITNAGGKVNARDQPPIRGFRHPGKGGLDDIRETIRGALYGHPVIKRVNLLAKARFNVLPADDAERSRIHRLA